MLVRQIGKLNSYILPILLLYILAVVLSLSHHYLDPVSQLCPNSTTQIFTDIDAMVVSYVNLVVHSFGYLLVLSCSCSPKTMATIYCGIISSSFISSVVILIVVVVVSVDVPLGVSTTNVIMFISNAMVTNWFFAIRCPTRYFKFFGNIYIMIYCFVIIGIVVITNYFNCF